MKQYELIEPVMFIYVSKTWFDLSVPGVVQIIGYISDVSTFLHQAYDSVISLKPELHAVQFKVQIVSGGFCGISMYSITPPLFPPSLSLSLSFLSSLSYSPSPLSPCLPLPLLSLSLSLSSSLSTPPSPLSPCLPLSLPLLPLPLSLSPSPSSSPPSHSYVRLN